MSDELVLQLDPPYAGSAVSPTVDITETTTDVTVTITDFRGEHSYSVEKTDQAIENAEQAATNANNAATQATATANAAAQYARDTADQAASDAQETADEAAGRADTAATNATQAAQAANTAAGTANTSAQNADSKAALADSKAALANQAATTANQAAQAAEAAKTAANTAAGQATTAAGNANTAAGTANTAAGNADAKAALADTAAQAAQTATANANTATTNATNAAQAANNAADYAIEAADDMPKLVNTASGTTPQTVNDAWPTTLERATLYGKSVQDGTPTPSNPVDVQVVSGVNVLVNPSRTAQSNGLTFVFDAMPSVKITGTTTGEWAFQRNDFFEVSPDTAFTVSLDKIPSEYFDGMYFSVRQFDENRAQVGQEVLFATWGTNANVKSKTFTTESQTRYFRYDIGCRYPNKTVDAVIYPQFEVGAQATPYVPYGCIGLQIGETVTPIDLQGHELAGGDALKVDSAGRVWIDKGADKDVIDGSNPSYLANVTARTGFTQVGYSPYVSKGITGTAFYSDTFDCTPDGALEGLGKVWGSNAAPRMFFGLPTTVTNATEAAAWFAEHPTTVYSPLAEPQTIELGTIELPEMLQECEVAIYASLSPEWAIEYEQDPNAVITALQSSIAPVEGSTASANYAVNSYLIHANQLYRVTSAIATGEAITPGSNCVACTVMGEVIRLTA